MSEEESSRRSPSSVPVAAPEGASWAHAEIEVFTTEALSRFGAPGTLCVEGGYLVLYAPQGVLRVELGNLDVQWGRLSEESRRRRCAELVRQLVARRSVLPTTPPRRPTPLWIWFAALGVAGSLAGWAAYAARPSVAKDTVVRRAAAAVPGEADAPEHEDRRQRAARICDNARTRVLRGATLGPTETEGWVVDVIALRQGAPAPLVGDQRLLEFVGAGPLGQLVPFVWTGEPDLRALEGSDTGVRVAAEQVEGKSGTRAEGVRLTFSGRLVDAYFDPEQRVRFFHVATALSERLEASHAGLVARCEGGTTHHLGSWFRGESAAEATSALLYFIGLYAEPPHLADPFLRPLGGEPDRGYAFSAIREATRPLDQRAVAALLGNSGGMITGAGSGASVITFPFTDGNRASRASREVARTVHLGRR